MENARDSVTKTLKRKGFKEETPSEEMVKRRKHNSIKNPIGLASFIFGVYLLLIFFNIVPFTPRFQAIFDDKTAILIISIALLLIGVILNDRIKNIFQK